VNRGFPAKSVIRLRGLVDPGRPAAPHSKELLVTSTVTLQSPTARTCSPAGALTRSLLGYGIVAGPLYVAVSAVQIATRAGFDPTVHAWSRLALGGPGWIQVTNLIVTGLMTTAFAVGLRRALAGGRADRWAPRLIALYGLSMVVSGLFKADAAQGFPVGTPDGPGVVSPHGVVHLGAGAVGFTALAAAAFVLARRFRDDGRPRWAMASRTVGTIVVVGFAAVASGIGSAGVLAFTAAVLAGAGWTCAVAANQYRRVQP